MEKSSWPNRISKAALGRGLLIGLLCATASHAGLGGLSGAYLRAPVGAAAFGRGGAFTAAPDHLCQWWNPAALADLKARTLTIGTGYRSMGRTDGYVGWEFKVPPRVAMGVTLLYRGDPFLRNLYDDQEYKLDDGSYTTLTAKLGFSYLISRQLSAGANISMFYQRLPVGYSGSSLIYSGGISDLSIGGFDLGLRYKARSNLVLGLVIKNLAAGVKVRTSSDYQYNVEINDQFLPSLTLGGELTTALAGKPFIWSSDLIGYLLDGEFNKLVHPQLVWNNGFEWHGWDKLHLRAGVRDLTFNGDMLRNNLRYQHGFTLAVSGGCYLDLSSVVKGLSVNYAMATNKVWHGVEQQLECVYAFPR